MKKRKESNFRRNNQPLIKKKKFCYFCKEKIEDIDYQNTELLSKFLDNYNRIRPASRSGVCARHQRKLSRAIKRARSMALLPYM